MCDEDQRRARRTVELEHDLLQVGARLGVKVPGGLIGKQDVRLVDECTRECNTLLFATRELRRIMPQAVSEAYFHEQIPCLRCDTASAAQLGRDHDVFERRERRKQSERLEHEPNVLIADAGPLVLAERSEVVAAQRDRSPRGTIKARAESKQRRFATTRRSHDRKRVSFVEIKGHGIEYREAPGATFKCFRQIPDGKYHSHMFTLNPEKNLLYGICLVGVLLLVGCSNNSDQRTDPGTLPTGRTAPSDTHLPAPPPETASGSELRIVFLGDSISAAYGLSEEEGYVYLIQQKLDSLGIDAHVVNAGVSGDTSSGGLSRIEWVLGTATDILVLELGGNDALRGIDLDVTRRNLAGIIEKSRRLNPGIRIIMVGMQVPPNLGTAYTQQFRELFPSLADEYGTELVPFLLEDVALVPGRMQDDGIHPTSEGHRIMAATMWDALQPVVEDATAP